MEGHKHPPSNWAPGDRVWGPWVPGDPVHTPALGLVSQPTGLQLSLAQGSPSIPVLQSQMTAICTGIRL